MVIEFSLLDEIVTFGSAKGKIIIRVNWGPLLRAKNLRHDVDFWELKE